MPIEIFIPVFVIVCIAGYIMGYHEKRRNQYYKDYLERKRKRKGNNDE